jgi:hypothetical protein
MTQTPNLNLPYLMPAQALKYITYNEAMLRLDSLAQLSVKSRASTPPTDPNVGDAYLVTPTATGDWTGFEDFIARSDASGNWEMLEPKTGWVCLVCDGRCLHGFFDTGWAEIQSPETMQTHFGVNAQADNLNRFIVKSENALFDNEGQSHRLKINKAAVSDTASLQFQTGYQSYGEIGLIGNNALSIKVSENATDWTEAIRCETHTGHTQIKNMYSGEIYLLNETAKTITPPKSGGFMMIMIDNEDYPQLSHAAIVAYDIGVSPNVILLGSGDKFRVADDQLLTGITGPDKFTTLSALNGSLMLENRYGTHQTYRFTFLG